MNIFGWRKNLSISEQDPTFKVRYLGNVQTALMKGEGCVDRASTVIWNNYMRSEHPGIEMKVVLTGSGMKAYTKEQGLTEYRAHRISYCIAHPDFPRLFVWVYRHEGRKMKMELRCHAVLCKNDAKAKAMALQLHEKLSFALKEFQREKLRKQNSRLVLQRTNSLPKTGSILPLRTQLLSTANNFRPPVSKSHTAPKLGAITEDVEELEEEDEDEYVLGASDSNLHVGRIKNNSNNDNNNSGGDLENESLPPTPASCGPSPPGLVYKGMEHHDILEALDLDSGGGGGEVEGEFFTSDPIIDLEMGNDVEELRHDDSVQYCLHETADSDEESAESGFHDQESAFPEPEPAEGGSAALSASKEKEAGARFKTRKGSGVEEEELDLTVCQLPSLEEEVTPTNSVSEKTPL